MAVTQQENLFHEKYFNKITSSFFINLNLFLNLMDCECVNRSKMKKPMAYF